MAEEQSRIFYRRQQLAQKLAERILSKNQVTAAVSGIFIGAPRRTGKTTFMREDLAPALTAMGAYVIYVDLWEDPKCDPSILIATAFRKELALHQNAIARIAKGMGISGMKLGGVDLSLDRLSLGKDVSLVQVLAALSDESKKMIVLIVDEAQHAITTEAGAAALTSLRAAREELNHAHFGLRVVCTGSNSDKLAMLRNSKDQAFFGAAMIPFPTLGYEYVEWACATATDLPSLIDVSLAANLFEQSGNRPEYLGAALDVLRWDFELSATNLNEKFEAAFINLLKDAEIEGLRVIKSLTPLQLAVLQVMSEKGSDYAPFTNETLGLYASKIGTLSTEVDITSAQGALIALQEKGLVWRASRGVYAVEDKTTNDLLKKL
jgi:hypothetical protein